MPRVETVEPSVSVEDYLPHVAGEFEIVDVPEFQFVMVDGEGDPEHSVAFGQALNWLYGVSYRLRVEGKGRGLVWSVGRLEGLWRAADLADFRAGRRDRWQWTLLIRQPDFLSAEDFLAARQHVAAKLGSPPPTLRMAKLREGLCVQVLHIGAYADEAPVIGRLHGEFLPAQHLAPCGDHHEIYLSDPRRTPPAKRRTVIRQPVSRVPPELEQRMDKARALA